MTYKKATSIELGKTYYYKDMGGSYHEEMNPSYGQLNAGSLYTKEETQADKVREILKTGWVKAINYDDFYRVETLCRFNSGMKVTIKGELYTQKEVIQRFESTTYEKALESL